MYVMLNQKNTIEPRIALNYQLNKSTSLSMGYGKYSTHEKAHNYFTKIQQPDGSFTEPNKELDILKADHYVAGFKKYFSENLVAKVEIYYQNLYDLPVEDIDTSYYCTINEGNDYQYVPLVNKGEGKNYGIELTLERYFDNNYYFVVNGSLYESKYKSLEGVWRNTMYNGNYMINLLLGKEFRELGKKHNKTLAVNIKSFVGGSQRYIPLLRDAEGNVAVDPENNQYWDYKKAYDNKLVHMYNVNASISFKINRSNSTHEIFLDLMNILHSKAHLSEYYDESQPDNIGYEKQMIFLPNVMYRVYF
jgi:outer membrane receptor protein involved in Fe transport